MNMLLFHFRKSNELIFDYIAHIKSKNYIKHFYALLKKNFQHNFFFIIILRRLFKKKV